MHAVSRHLRQFHCSAPSMASLRALTVVDLVVADHQNISAMFDRCKLACQESEPQAVQALVPSIAVSVLLHSRAEEEVLYPFMVKALGDEGKHFSEHSDKEHKELEATLMKAMRLKSLRDGGEQLLATLEEARKEFEHHKKDEEEKYLPKLLEATSEQELADLGAAFSRAKHRASLDKLTF